MVPMDVFFYVYWQIIEIVIENFLRILAVVDRLFLGLIRDFLGGLEGVLGG
jgi:hypothetical protein